MKWGRRPFLQSLAALSASHPLIRVTAQTDDLPSFATALLFALVPNRDVPEALYHQSATRLIESESGRQLLSTARLSLQELTGHDWMVLDAESRITTLLRVMDRPALQQLRRTMAGAVYSHPDSFAATGYGGSSLEFGGYLNRGFNDIDWLPEATP